MNDIDTNFDFTTDTPKFWDNFWNNNDGFGAGSNDYKQLSSVIIDNLNEFEGVKV